MSDRRNIEDIYPLTPMQQGMLFHALYASESGVYVQQVSARLSGSLDASFVRRTWQALVDRHPVLRTGFEWERRADPFQVVYKRATLPWNELDWSGESEHEQDTRLEALLSADRARGFVLRAAPLMRMTLVRRGPASWQLVWSHHHLILDGWSVPRLLEDFFTAYEAGTAGREPSFAPRRPFRDHVAWLETRDRAQAERFWSADLRGIEAPPPRPATAAERSGRSFAGAPTHADTRLSREDTERLTAFARTNHLTVSTVLQGAWALVLSRFTGVSHALFGATVSGRPPEVAGADAMIGLFINTLPVRVHVRPGVRVSAWLRALQDRIARQRAFEHTPLVDILGWSGLGGASSPLETLFVFENYPVDASLDTRVPALRIEAADAHEQTNFPITLVAAPATQLLLKIDYDGGRYDPALIERLLASLRRVISAFAAGDDKPLGVVDMLAPGERSRIESWRDGAAVPPSPLVHELIDERAAISPEATAIRDGARTVTFSALRDRSDAVARGLRARGIGIDDRIGVVLPSSADLIAALLGVLKAGAAYVPIDPSHPEPRRRYVAENSGVRLVIDEETFRGLVRAHEHATTSPVPREALAYVLYTSGSTGEPKGVMVTHDGLANYVCWAAETFQADAGTGAPFHSPLGFDLTVTSLFPPLVAGRAVQIVPTADRLEALTDALAASPGFSLVKLTPPHLDALRDLLPAEAAASAARAFVIGGEALTHEQLEHWRTHAPDTHLFNEYGPTETVVGCAIYDARPDRLQSGAVPIGGPIANTRLYVLDDTLSPVPIGVAGELFIAGAGVARGYQSQPGLTAERFLPDPFSPARGARMYRSSDRARHRPDGVLEFLGRADDQLKIRGYRMEPGEIEAALAPHPDVASAAVVAARDAAGDLYLAAFVTPAAAASNGLREFLRGRLPDYMIPATIAGIDALPLTWNGKVDRRALAARARAESRQSRAIEPPRGPLEELLAAIWCDVLHVETLGRHDGFFELGGHSLVATRLVARIRQAFATDLPLKAIFEAPTIATLAARLSHAAEDRAGRIQPRPVGVPPVLSSAQRRLWFLDELTPGSAAYLVPAALDIEGALDVDALRAALQQVVDRHEVLRTRIDTVDGAPVVTIQDGVALRFDVFDLSELNETVRSREVERHAAEEARRPFRLDRPPLARVRLLRLRPERHVLLLTLHHIASDAWSMEVLVDEAARLYDARDRNRGVALPPLRLQYADVAWWEQTHDVDRADALNYWRNKLVDVPHLELPHDASRPLSPAFTGAAVTIHLPGEAEALVQAARADNATPFMAFLAVFELLLARYSAQDDFAIGAPVAHRDRAEIAGLIGFFMNTLVVRSDVAGGGTFRELVRRVRATTLDAHANGSVAFEKLVDVLQPSRELAHHPLFQVTFTLQHATRPIQLAGLRLAALPTRAVTAKFDLSLSIAETADGWQATFEYSTELFESAAIERLSSHYAALVTAAARMPDVDVRVLEMLGADEQQAAIQRGPTIAGSPFAGATGRLEITPVHVQIAEQAARTPDATALVFEDQRLTYRELENRSAALAWRLRRDGISRDAAVGVQIDRSIDLVVAMLGALEAGAAYVPIDPSYPSGRVDAMIADAGVQAVLRDASARPCQDLLPVDPDPDSLAYILFTSGSTGRPKGAMISHAALANHMAWMQRVYPLGPGDRVLQKTPSSFDASVWEFWAPLMAGATLVIARPGGHHDPEYLVDTIQRQQITTLQVVPSLLRLLLDVEGFPRCTTLRRVFAGGEALTGDLRDRFFAASAADLINLYGPTEVTIDSVVCGCDRGNTSAHVPIGHPVDRTTAYVLDGRLGLVPDGVAGELYLGGPQVARGYVGQPALTGERFLPDPFAGAPGARMYRTGDRVRRPASGALEYLGRVDYQIKLRGFRIEPAEIERVLEQHAAIRQAVVCVRTSGPAPRLVAYVTCRDDSAVNEMTLRAHAQAMLPEHMVPAAFVVLDELPVLPNGKVDRRRLPDPARENTEAVRPRNRAEAILAGIWADVLGVSSVSVTDNFFSLGGDSILSLQVVARARAAGWRITPAQIFTHQTVETLARESTRILGSDPHEGSAHGAATGAIPLTPAQRWFFDLDLPERHHWNQAMLLETPGDLDIRSLEAALADVATRHDAFRLRFDDSQQRYADASMLPLTVVDLRDPEPDEGLRVELDRLQASLSLTDGPLARAACFRLDARRGGRLLLVSHHLIVDGVSWRILLDDLLVAYDARRSGRAPVFPAQTTPWHAWARSMAEQVQAPALARERDYWTRQLAAAPRLRTDEGGENREADARHVDVALPRELTAQLLREAPGVYGAYPVDLMLAALVDAVEPWTGGRALLVEMEGHGRDVLDLDVSRTVGWFTTLYPVRLAAGDAHGPAALIKTIKEQLRAVPRKGFGFGMLRYVSPDAARLPRVAPEISFNYHGQWRGAADAHNGFRTAPEPPGALRGPSAPRTHLLEIVAGVVEGRLRVRWTYGARQYRRDTIAAIAGAYLTSLRLLVEHCLTAERSYTPSDFSAAGLDQRDLDKLLSRLRGV